MTDLTPEPAATVNVPLLRKQLEWATSEHAKATRGEFSEWDQDKWCGTRCCIAGHTALDTGWTTHTYPDGAVSTVLTRGTESEHVRYVAQDALGLTWDEAQTLFDGKNQISDLWRIANKVTNGEIEIPAEVSA